MIPPGTRDAPFVDSETRTAVARPWKVVVLNDPVNLMSYVTWVFRKVFGYPESRARRHMMEVHTLGRSVLWSGERERAEAYAQELHHWQLRTILEADD